MYEICARGIPCIVYMPDAPLNSYYLLVVSLQFDFLLGAACEERHRRQLRMNFFEIMVQIFRNCGTAPPFRSIADKSPGDWQVRRALQRLPLGPDESHSIAALEQRAAALRARAEELRAQTVPRPQPSQYPALQQELARFMHNLGSVQRIAALLQALQVCPTSAPALSKLMLELHSCMTLVSPKRVQSLSSSRSRALWGWLCIGILLFHVDCPSGCQ